MLRSVAKDVAEERVAQGDLAFVDKSEAEPVRRVAVSYAGVGVGEPEGAPLPGVPKAAFAALPNGISAVGLR